MTGGVVPAQRLLAMLTDEDTLESAPLDDVRADLAAFGVDPARCVALTRRLASAPASPARRLLESLAEGEDSDGEIERLAAADPERVRTEVPPGRASAIAERARQAAGAKTRVVGLPRRLRLLGWGGGFAAAASLVLVVGFYLSSNWQPPLILGRDAIVERAPLGLTQVPGSPSLEPTGVVPNAKSEREGSTVGTLAPEEGLLESTPQRSSDALTAVSTIAAAPPEVDVPEPVVGAAAIAALLVVDPRRVPPSLNRVRYPEGELQRRLAEARRAAAGRSVVALVTVTYPERRIDAVLVERATARARANEQAAGVLDRLLAADADKFELIVLPERR